MTKKPTGKQKPKGKEGKPRTPRKPKVALLPGEQIKRGTVYVERLWRPGDPPQMFQDMSIHVEVRRHEGQWKADVHYVDTQGNPIRYHIIHEVFERLFDYRERIIREGRSERSKEAAKKRNVPLHTDYDQPQVFRKQE